MIYGRKTNLCGIHLLPRNRQGLPSRRTDFKLMRTAFSSKTLWDTLTERTVPRFDREGVERHVCELSGLHELEKVHGTSDTQQE